MSDIDTGNRSYQESNADNSDVHNGLKKKMKRGLISKNESNTVRKNHIENKYLRDKIQHIEMESSYNFKNIIHTSLNTERSIDKIKISTGRAFKENSLYSDSLGLSEPADSTGITLTLF